MSVFADHPFAVRVEALAATGMRRLAEATLSLYPDLDAMWTQVGGGVAAYLGEGSPVNGTAGFGMPGEVTAADVEALERFFAARGERPLASVCPMAHPSVARLLGARGWTIGAFENVLARTLDSDLVLPEPDAHIEIRVARTPDELELWALMVANGFSAPYDPTPAEMRLGRAATAREDSAFLIGYIDGAPAGTGELQLEDGVGWLSADTTLPQFRGRGVQRSLQRARLALAFDAGCDIAVSESMPGSGSQRNMERLGFSVAYTRVDALGPNPASA